jgi:hypothetical protein
VRLKRRPDRGTIHALRADLEELSARLDAAAGTLSPGE